MDNNDKEEVSDSTIVKWIKEKMKIRWESMWRRSESGMWTKELIGGRVGRKLMFPKRRCEGMPYVRAMVNNAAVKDNMFRMGFEEKRSCLCEESNETVEHVLMECKLEREGRCELEKAVGDLWMDSKRVGGIPFDLRTILFPYNNDKLDAELSSSIMKATFKYFKL